MKTHKKNRREAALARQGIYNKLTPQQKIAKLDRMFGAGKGASKERKKLQLLINNINEQA